MKNNVITTDMHKIIDAQKLIEATNDGLDIYKHFIPDLELVEDKRCKNTYNPFYDDSHPSLSIYFMHGRWRHKDHGDDTFAGDFFDFAAHSYELDKKEDFVKILNSLVRDLELDTRDLSMDVDERIYVRGYLIKGEDYKKDEDGLNTAYSYFSNYGISKEVLKRFRVRAIRGYSYLDKDEKIQTFNCKKDDLAIAYEELDFCKLYFPNNKDYRFRYIGSKPSDYVFGLRQLIDRAAKAERFEGEILVITGGEKDVMTLTSLGYDAICLNSETTANISHDCFEFISMYKRIIVLYDSDETGRRSALKLSKQYNFEIAVLPVDSADKGCKDVSDYVRNGLDINILKQSIITASKDNDIKTCTESKEETIENETDSEVYSTPTLPDELYNLIPDCLKKFTSKFSDARERDIALLSTLGVLSSCFPIFKGMYRNIELGCNFYIFFVAPASSGKSAMNWGYRTGKRIHKYLKDIHINEMDEYKKSIADKNKRTNKEAEVPKPVRKLLFIPANNSTSSVIELLDANKKFGVMFSTEGDTLASALKNEWGDFSSIIRQAFQHEPISLSRRANKELIELEHPHLSIVISGTPDQVQNLMYNIENGLFSRFLFYDFRTKVEWKDQFEGQDTTLNEYIKKFAFQLKEFWKMQEKKPNIYVTMDSDQREIMKLYFSEKLKEFNSEFGEGIVASVKRAAIVYYRLAMLFTAISCFENKSLPTRNQLTVNDKHFDAAFYIIDTLLEHLKVVYMRLQNISKLSKLKTQQKVVFESLPMKFDRSTYNAVLKQNDIKCKTGERYIDVYLKHQLLERTKHGEYQKL